jgi:TetR/AcrR family transcriptional regulator, cholesterol catabolism regulator
MSSRREQIEEVASALFSARGYRATSMRDIASALDIQGASLYSHVSSKEAVLASIVERAAERFHQAVQPIAEGAGTAPERLRRMIDAHVRVVTDGRERAHVFLFEWTSLGPEPRERIAVARDAYEDHFTRVIAEGIEAGELVMEDPRLSAVFLLSAMNALAHWYRPEGRLSPEAIAGHYADLFLHGLQRPAGLLDPGERAAEAATIAAAGGMQ